MTQLRSIALLGLVFLLAGSLVSLAAGPEYLPDSDLAKYPIIVIAQWKKEAGITFNKHNGWHGQVGTDDQITLEVLRTIAGPVKPGLYKVELGRDIGWSVDGSNLNSHTTALGDSPIKDITVPNIWFLKHSESWDVKTRAPRLVVENFVSIQSLEFETFYKALRSPDPHSVLPKLLTATESRFNDRIFNYLCDERNFWPYRGGIDDESFADPATLAKINPATIQAIAELIGKESLQKQRATAVAVYGELTGMTGSPFLRTLLTDKVPEVRSMAAAVLIHNQDIESIPLIINSTQEITDPWLCCKMIAAIRHRKDLRMVPLLIRFLEDGRAAGGNFVIPAFHARTALYEMTGYVFPYDVAASAAAWEHAGSITNIEERNRALFSLIPTASMPLGLKLVTKARKVEVQTWKLSTASEPTTNQVPYWESQSVYLQVENISKQVVMVEKIPSESYPLTSEDNPAPRTDLTSTGKSGFLSLQPGETLQYMYGLENNFVVAGPDFRTCLPIHEPGMIHFDVNAWAGSIPNLFGADPKEVHRIECVVETWPQRTLKTTGQTANGEKYGDWNFFNEEGIRTQRVTYTLQPKGKTGATVINAAPLP